MNLGRMAIHVQQFHQYSQVVTSFINLWGEQTHMHTSAG